MRHVPWLTNNRGACHGQAKAAPPHPLLTQLQWEVEESTRWAVNPVLYPCTADKSTALVLLPGTSDETLIISRGLPEAYSAGGMGSFFPFPGPWALFSIVTALPGTECLLFLNTEFHIGKLPRGPL